MFIEGKIMHVIKYDKGTSFLHRILNLYTNKCINIIENTKFYANI